MNSRQRRKRRRTALRSVHKRLDIALRFWLEMDRRMMDIGAKMAALSICLTLCMACGTGTGDDAGMPAEDAGQTDAGYDAGEEPIDDAWTLDACEERQAQWCRQGCIGTIGIDRDCPELDCEC